MRGFANLIDYTSQAEGPPPEKFWHFMRWALRGALPAIFLGLIVSVAVGATEVGFVKGGERTVKAEVIKNGEATDDEVTFSCESGAVKLVKNGKSVTISASAATASSGVTGGAIRNVWSSAAVSAIRRCAAPTSC